MKKFYKLTIPLLALMATAAPKVSAVPNFWNESAYAVECKSTPIKSVLDDFSRNFGVNLVFSGRIAGNCENWRRSDTAVAFLDQLSTEFRFNWFVYKGNLYVSPKNDNITKRMEAGEDFKQALMGLNLYKDKFGWGELPDSNAFIVSGPKKYVDLISRLVDTQKEKEKNEQNGNIHIFKLKYAPVEDREISIRNKQVTIQGVSTILKNLLTSGKKNKKTSTKGGKISTNDSSTNFDEFLESDSIQVESDIRTNSIFIKAPEQNYTFYKTIIDSLDVSSNLVEIDAIIVDVSRDKLREIGANFQFTEKESRFNFNTNTVGANSQQISPNANATILIKDLGAFYTNLRALEGKGHASIIANTSILTLDNQPAVIDLSETVFIQTVGERVANLREVTAGTLLNVTPMTIETNEGSKIKMEVEIEDGKLSEINGSNSIPRIQKTTISTKAVINQNRSLVIGGYHLQKSLIENKGVPGLQSIPGVGRLFKTKVARESHLERLFILTPRISPTFHNPEDYGSAYSADLIAAAVNRIKTRWDMATKSYVEKTKILLTELASRKMPSGYKFEQHKNLPTVFKCYQNNMSFDFTGGQTITGHGLSAFIGVVTNNGERSARVDESVCRGKGLIAVSIFPKTFLEPGERTEIFISMETARMSKDTRDYLVSSNK